MRFRFCLLFFFISILAYSQKFTISTNLLSYANLGTLDLSCSYSVSRHISVESNLKYNNFDFGKNNVLNKQRSLGVGLRYWLWYHNSGWWLSSMLRYQEYNTNKFFSKFNYQGDRMGLSLGGGYSLMLSRHFNLDFGLRLWTGYDKGSKYSCYTCGKLTDTYRKIFIYPDDIIMSLVYVF